MIKKRPGFDARNYGFDKLSKLIKSLSDYFETDERTTDKATIKLVYQNKKITVTVSEFQSVSLINKDHCSVSTLGFVLFINASLMHQRFNRL